jgi:hypothetical protein
MLTGLTLVCVMAVLLPAVTVSAQEGAQPAILIEEMRHDMGEVFERDFYKFTFKFKNVGEADLQIKSVKPG